MEHSTLEVAPSIWDCDKCHQPISCAEHGVLEWTFDREQSRRHGFKIVHHSEYSPVKNAFRRNPCSFYGQAPQGDVSLQQLVGPAGLAYLLSFVDQGLFVHAKMRGPEVTHIWEWAEIVRRLHLPYYDEARQYLDEEKEKGELDDFDAAAGYSPEFLADLLASKVQEDF